MDDLDSYRRFTLRRILSRLQRELDALFKRNRVVFFRCDPIEGEESLRGELVEADLDRYEQWRRTEADFPWPPPEEGPRRYGEGHRLFALVSGGQARCYGWVSEMKSFWIDELKDTYGADIPMTWIWDCVTPAAMRNRGYYTDFLRALRRKFRDHELLIYSHANNAPSLRAIQRAGFLPWAIVVQHPGGTKIDFLLPKYGANLHALPVR